MAFGQLKPLEEQQELSRIGVELRRSPSTKGKGGRPIRNNNNKEKEKEKEMKEVRRYKLSSLLSSSPQSHLLDRPFVITGMTKTPSSSKDYWNLSNITKNHIPDETTNCVRIYEPIDDTSPKSKRKLIPTNPEISFRDFKEKIASGLAYKHNIYWAYSSPGKDFTSSLLKVVPSIVQVEQHLGLKDEQESDEEPLTAWLSASPHIEPLHYDNSSNLHVCLRGRKHWILFPPSSTTILKKKMSGGGIRFHGVWDLLWNKKEIPFDEIGPDPTMSSLPIEFDLSSVGINVWLDEGDALYLPSCWPHEVRTILPDNSSSKGDAEEPFVFTVNRFFKKNYVVVNWEGVVASYLGMRISVYNKVVSWRGTKNDQI